MSNPSEPPPSYEAAMNTNNNNNNSNQASSSSHHQQSSNNHLQVPGQTDDDDIPTAIRRSMEDEARPLPKGWVRSYDPESSHQFFVDTTTDPPRSIWTHPYDDDEYLRSLSSEDRERIEHESLRRPSDAQPSRADIMHDHTDNEDDETIPNDLPPRSKAEGKKSFGRKMKDKLTGSTHEERERERAQRAQKELEMYQRHIAIRQAMNKAMETGKPQLIGRDRDGQDVWLEPPQYQGSNRYPGGYGYSPYGRGGLGGGIGGGGMYGGGYGGGLYAPPGMYRRPAGVYGRPYGRGFGGGYGMPMALGGGLLGGMMLGGAMGGGMC